MREDRVERHRACNGRERPHCDRLVGKVNTRGHLLRMRQTGKINRCCNSTSG